MVSSHQTVCVTGASGFIGSWVVSLLLQGGYRVRGTVQNLGDDRETKHLRALEGAEDRLELFQIDVLDYESLQTAIGKSDGVFHLASPCFLGQPKDPQKELLDPALEGTLNALRASQAAGVKRVVLTSSAGAMYYNPNIPPGVVVDENLYSDIELCKKDKLWYMASKTIAEKAAWEFCEQTGLEMAVINPSFVFGKNLSPVLNASMALLLNLIQGPPGAQDLTQSIGIVHVEDVAKAHVLLYENLAAKGRHLCNAEIFTYNELAEKVTEMFTQYNIPRLKEDNLGHVRVPNPSKRLLDLGFTFTAGDIIIRDAVLSLQERGFLLA